MEQISQTSCASESKRIIEGQIRECFGRVVYSHKSQEKCADILLSRLSKIKLLQIVLSGITTAGFVSVVFGAGQVGAIIGVVVSVMLLALNTYTKDYNLGELAQQHREAANALWIIREKYLSLLTDLAIGNKSLESLQKERDDLAIELHAIYKGCPSTTFQAYQKAREALKKNEEITFSDLEIDEFLPTELRRSKPK